MKLEFLYLPTNDLAGTLATYREVFGATELWREGDTTAALSLPNTSAQLMLDASDPDAPVGPMFVVESVQAFHTSRPSSLTVVAEPSEIPGGAMAVYRDPGGTTIYLLDQSSDTEAGS